MRLFFYNCLILILLPFMVIRIFLKSLKDKDYIKNLKNRFGIYSEEPQENLIWFHAVSLGEVISSQSLVYKILEKDNIVLSVSTPTGLREARKIYQNKLQIVYAPWDFVAFVDRFLNHFNPKALILFETEIWPIFINSSSKRNLPIILSNARLSESSFKRYKSLKFFIKDILSLFSIILVQSKKHAVRFEGIGANKEVIYEVGSVKFDSVIQDDKSKSVNNIETDFILATSTHEGEDEIIIDSFIELRKELAGIKMVIVPRHPERSKSISDILSKNKIKNEIYKDLPKGFNENEVIVIGQTGLLNELYQMAKVSLIGGSLKSKYGGHNIIEAASNMCSFIVGPYMRNFEDILDLFISEDACIKLNHPDELSLAFKKLLDNDSLRKDMVDKALKVINENKGSTKKQFEYIQNILK